MLNASAQSFDYQSRPVFKFDYLEAAVNLKLNTTQTKVSGSVTYLVEANITGADSLILHAPGVAIGSVIFGQTVPAFSTEQGKLIISIPDSSVSNEQYRIKIYYRADPRFGLLKDSEGTIWTSLLPKTHDHWLPSPGHPRIEAITKLTLNIPAEYIVAASGVKTNDRVLGLERKKVTFRTAQPVPLTSLAFTVGKFNIVGTSYGIKRIISYAEPNTIKPSLQRKLVDKAKKLITLIENNVKTEYPYQRLHIVVLNDHLWEQKPYGASVIYLYQNRGNLVNQLRRGLYGQWFGVYQHEGQWADSWPIQMFQSALHYRIADSPAYLESKDVPETNFMTIYNHYSVRRWNYWQKMVQWKSDETRHIATKIIPEILNIDSGTFSPQRYKNIWYRYSGMPEIKVPLIKVETENEKRFLYRVDFRKQKNSLKIIFTASKNVLANPEAVTFQIVEGNAVTAKKVSFSGRKDSVSISIPAGTQNIKIKANPSDNLNFEIHKPVPFILYQLENAEGTAARKRAALQLGYHTENPDLQLVITGYLNQKMKPKVKAALLKSYAAITAGAAGTQQYFIEALSASNKIVRQAALKALQNYPHNPQITQKLKSIINQGDSVSKKILSMYIQRINSKQAHDFVLNLVKQDTAGTKAVSALAILASTGQTKEAIKWAKFYIKPVYTYPVRKQALQILLKYDDSAKRWDKRIGMLLTDLDPRIRYLTIQNLSKIPGVKRREVLQKYIPTAYDARIFKAISLD